MSPYFYCIHIQQASKNYKRLKKAVVLAQSLFRGKQARIHFNRMKAAITIQAIVRCHQVYPLYSCPNYILRLKESIKAWNEQLFWLKAFLEWSKLAEPIKYWRVLLLESSLYGEVDKPESNTPKHYRRLSQFKASLAVTWPSVHILPSEAVPSLFRLLWEDITSVFTLLEWRLPS